MAQNVNQELITASIEFKNLAQQVMDEFNHEFNQAPSLPVKH